MAINRGEKVKEFRKFAKKSQKQMAEICGIKQSSYFAIENKDDAKLPQSFLEFFVRKGGNFYWLFLDRGPMLRSKGEAIPINGHPINPEDIREALVYANEALADKKIVPIELGNIVGALAQKIAQYKSEGREDFEIEIYVKGMIEGMLKSIQDEKAKKKSN